MASFDERRRRKKHEATRFLAEAKAILSSESYRAFKLRMREQTARRTDLRDTVEYVAQLFKEEVHDAQTRRSMLATFCNFLPPDKRPHYAPLLVKDMPSSVDASPQNIAPVPRKRPLAPPAEQQALQAVLVNRRVHKMAQQRKKEERLLKKARSVAPVSVSPDKTPTTPTPAQKSLPTPKGQKCPICRDILIEPAAAHCGHVLCTACWERALQNKLECPMCRKPARKGHLNRVFLN